MAPIHRNTSAALAAMLLALGGTAAAEALTWKDANRRSAESIRVHGPTVEGAELARTAFERYALEATRYDASTHAQLLLNLVDVVHRASGMKPALLQLEKGAAQVAGKAGGDAVLVDIWKEGARLAMAGHNPPAANQYYEMASSIADKAWGAEHPESIALQILWIQHLRMQRGYAWAKARYQAVRLLAITHGEGNALVSSVDLGLAKLELERRKWSSAITAYQQLLERLEARHDPEQEIIAQLAYGQLEYAHEQAGDDEAAEEVRHRRARAKSSLRELRPLARTKPHYPRFAARNRTEGRVTLLLTVAPDGTVSDADVVESEPEGIFDEAAVKAVRSWKFTPRTRDGEPVEQVGLQTIDFKMGD